MNNYPSSKHIQAIVVNHNTSKYTELMLRSLFATHSSDLDLSVTVFDNNSQDDKTKLEAYAKGKGIPIVKSGFELKTKWNSHGEILSKFVLENLNCDYYLFLDTDTCFIQNDTINTMLRELEQDPTVFGISPRISSNGETEIEEEYWEIVYHYRLHPCCALVKNTTVFRRVVKEIGLSCVQYLWAKGEEYLDTFKLMSMVMKTHGCQHILSSKMILHFFSVSYDREPQQVMEFKAGLRDKLLEKLRNLEGS
ncbi:MAG: glycosyltransferase [Candidatus Hodarchaeota archaeon]